MEQSIQESCQQPWLQMGTNLSNQVHPPVCAAHVGAQGVRHPSGLIHEGAAGQVCDGFGHGAGSIGGHEDRGIGNLVQGWETTKCRPIFHVLFNATGTDVAACVPPSSWWAWRMASKSWRKALSAKPLPISTRLNLIQVKMGPIRSPFFSAGPITI